MKKNYKALLEGIQALVFDVDGVMTDNRITLLPDGSLVRSVHARDGYALQFAVQRGVHIGIITGGRSEIVKKRLQSLGITDIYMNAQNKIEPYADLCGKHELKPEQILYMGDDILDREVMQSSGVAACPVDAVAEIKAIADYISPLRGGHGCVRDIVEQTLKVKGLWI